jgi:hypothetical protein
LRQRKQERPKLGREAEFGTLDNAHSLNSHQLGGGWGGEGGDELREEGGSQMAWGPPAIMRTWILS